MLEIDCNKHPTVSVAGRFEHWCGLELAIIIPHIKFGVSTFTHYGRNKSYYLNFKIVVVHRLAFLNSGTFNRNF